MFIRGRRNFFIEAEAAADDGLGMGDGADAGDIGDGADSGDAGNADGGDKGGVVTERPEYILERFWDAEKGEIRVENLGKSYKELLAKMSGKNVAPEEYEIRQPEGLEFEVDSDDPLLKSMTGLFKKAGMSQDQFDEIFAEYAMHQAAELKAIEEYKKAQMSALGPQAKHRLSNVNDWVHANFDDRLAKALASRVDSVEMVEVMEALMSLGKPPSLSPAAVADTGIAEIHKKLREEQFATDKNGRRLMKDPQYAADWRARAAKHGYRG